MRIYKRQKLSRSRFSDSFNFKGSFAVPRLFLKLELRSIPGLYFANTARTFPKALTALNLVCKFGVLYVYVYAGSSERVGEIICSEVYVSEG